MVLLLWNSMFIQSRNQSIITTTTSAWFNITTDWFCKHTLFQHIVEWVLSPLPGWCHGIELGMWTSRNFRCSSISIRSFSIKITFRAEKFRATFEPSNIRSENFRTQFDPSQSRTSNRAVFEHQAKWFILNKTHH